jgi:hypothetical protein
MLKLLRGRRHFDGGRLAIPQRKIENDLSEEEL